jgi:hypothetical protein
MWIILGFGIAFFFYVWTINFIYWVNHKVILSIIAFKLLKSKTPEIKKLGWDALKLVFWETNKKEKNGL